MKTKRFFNLISGGRLASGLGALAIALVAGCATGPTPTPGPTPGPGPAPISRAASNTIAVLDVTVPIAVAVECARQPESVLFFRAAAEVIEAVAGGTNDASLDLSAALRELAGKAFTNLSPNAELAVMAGLVLYESFVAQHGLSGLELNADQRAILRALAVDIRRGLPPATMDSVRGFEAGTGEGRNAKGIGRGDAKELNTKQTKETKRSEKNRTSRTDMSVDLRVILGALGTEREETQRA